MSPTCAPVLSTTARRSRQAARRIEGTNRRTRSPVGGLRVPASVGRGEIYTLGDVAGSVDRDRPAALSRSPRGSRSSTRSPSATSGRARYRRVRRRCTPATVCVGGARGGRTPRMGVAEAVPLVVRFHNLHRVGQAWPPVAGRPRARRSQSRLVRPGILTVVLARTVRVRCRASGAHTSGPHPMHPRPRWQPDRPLPT